MSVHIKEHQEFIYDLQKLNTVQYINKLVSHNVWA